MAILGINHSNDSAAAIVSEGEVRAANAEERFSRQKHDGRFPNRSIQFALDHAETRLDDCEAIGFFWNPVQHMDASNRRWLHPPRTHLEYLFSVPNHLVAGCDMSDLDYVQLNLPFKASRSLQIFFINHHLCHAAHAFFESPFEDAAILTVDGYGERVSTLIARGKGSSIEPLIEIRFPHSLGSVYAAITQYLGFCANAHEGKVMGLSSYGDPVYVDLFRKMIVPTRRGFDVDLSYFSYYSDQKNRFSAKLVETLGEPRSADQAIEARHENIAASLQQVTEEILVHLAQLAYKETKSAHLCASGGVMLNCVANGRIVRESPFDQFFFQPACSDAGTSAGAALYLEHVVFGRPRTFPAVKTDYLGPSFSTDAMRRSLRNAGLRFSEPADIYEQAAVKLSQGRILGRFDGRGEYGPRALGNRSILAAPGPQDVKDTINRRVKHREMFRPFAPSVLENHCGEYFDCATPSPFMLRVYQTREQWRTQLGAITHVDGTARIQTVNQKQNPAYARLIEAFGNQSGTFCVLNTSFNVRGEPIVNSPEDALRCFFSTDMDTLHLGPFVVEKKQ